MNDFIKILPIVIPLAWMVIQIPELVDKLNECLKGWKRAVKVVLSVFTCLKCSSFWVTMIYTGDFFTSCLVSFICDIVERNLLSNNIKL